MLHIACADNPLVMTHALPDCLSLLVEETGKSRCRHRRSWSAVHRGRAPRDAVVDLGGPVLHSGAW